MSFWVVAPTASDFITEKRSLLNFLKKITFLGIKMLKMYMFACVQSETFRYK